MKKLALITLLGLVSFNAHAYKITSGSCQLEASKEVIELKEYDPLQHFGMFAQGFSSKGHRVFLSQIMIVGRIDEVVIHIQSESGNAYTSIPMKAGIEAPLKLGITVNTGTPQSEWLSCSLTIK